MSAAASGAGTGASPWRARMAILLLAYSICILYSTLLPFQFTWGEGDASYLGFTLGRDSSHRWPTPAGDLLGNVVLFLPLGALGYGMQPPTRLRKRWGAVGLAASVGLLLSLAVEVLQRFTPARDPSTSDVIANTCGSLLGALVAAGGQGRLQSSRLGRLAARSGENPWARAAVGMTIVVALYSLLPFDASLNRVLFRRSLRLACLDPRHDPASWGHLAEGGLLHALLAGVVVRLARRRVGPAPGLLWGLGFTLVVSVFLECLQVLIKSQVAATLDVCGAVVGGAAGAVLAIGLGTGSMRRYAWHAVVGFYAVGLVFLRVHWLGAGGGTDLIQERLGTLVPIYGRYFESNLARIVEFVNLLLLFAPLGFLVAQRLPAKLPAEWRYGVVAIACGGWMAFVELLHRLGSEGAPRFSGVIPALLGGLVGSTAWRWREQSAHPDFHAGESGRSGPPGSAARPLPSERVEPGQLRTRVPMEM